MSDVERIQNTLILISGQIMNYEKNNQTKRWIENNDIEDRCFADTIKIKIETKERR